MRRTQRAHVFMTVLLMLWMMTYAHARRECRHGCFDDVNNDCRQCPEGITKLREEGDELREYSPNVDSSGREDHPHHGRHGQKRLAWVGVGVSVGILILLCFLLSLLYLYCKRRCRSARNAAKHRYQTSIHHQTSIQHNDYSVSPSAKRGTNRSLPVRHVYEAQPLMTQPPNPLPTETRMIRTTDDDEHHRRISDTKREFEIRRGRSSSNDQEETNLEMSGDWSSVFHNHHEKSSKSYSTSSFEPNSLSSSSASRASSATRRRSSSTSDDLPTQQELPMVTDHQAISPISMNNVHAATESPNDARIRRLRQRFQDLISNIPIADQLDVMFTTADFAMGMFNQRGGYLDIPDTSVQLYIPPGALPDGSHQEVYIYLHHSSEDQKEDGVNQGQYDSMRKGSNAPVSPTIRCGPPGLQFKPDIFGVVLSFPSVHNGSDVNVVTKNSGDSHWKNLTNEKSERCIASSEDNVHLMINHFSDFKTEKITGDGEAIASGGKETGLRIAAFGRPLQLKQHIFQCYLCAWDSSSQKKILDDSAARLGYHPLQDGNKLFEGINKNDLIKIRLSDLKNGWVLHYPEQKEQNIEVSKHHYDRCDFDMEYIQGAEYTGGLDCRFTANVNSQEVILPIHVNEGWKCKTLLVPCHDDDDEEAVSTPVEALGKLTFGRVHPKVSPHLSVSAYYDLCAVLNLKTYPPTDWRLLMAEIGLEEMRFIHQVEDGKEPGAVVVINLFFSQNRGQVALEKLHSACRKVKLHRAVEILERDQPFLCAGHMDSPLTDTCGGHMDSPLTDNVNVPQRGSSQECTGSCGIKAVDNYASNRFIFSTSVLAPNNRVAYLPDVTQPTSANSLTHMMNHNSNVPSGSSSLSDSNPDVISSDSNHSVSQPKSAYDVNHNTNHHSHATIEMVDSNPMHAMETYV